MHFFLPAQRHSQWLRPFFVSAEFVWAVEPASDRAAAAACLCPKGGDGGSSKLTDLKNELDQNDGLAALESVQFALTEVADGSSYLCAAATAACRAS
jgi:hypothetical protein